MGLVSLPSNRRERDETAAAGVLIADAYRGSSQRTVEVVTLSSLGEGPFTAVSGTVAFIGN